MTSTLKSLPSICVAVRQTPLTAMEPPRARPSVVPGAWSRTVALTSPLRSMDSTFPCSAIIPVNISCLLRRCPRRCGAGWYRMKERWRSGAGRAKVKPEVAAEHLDGTTGCRIPFPALGVGQRGDAEVLEGRGAGAEERRRQVDDEFVDQAGARNALRIREPPSTMTCRTPFRTARPVPRAGRAWQVQDVAVATVDGRVVGNAPVSHDGAQRLFAARFAVGVPGGEPGVVDEHRLGADEDRVYPAAEGVVVGQAIPGWKSTGWCRRWRRCTKSSGAPCRSGSCSRPTTGSSSTHRSPRATGTTWSTTTSMGRASWASPARPGRRSPASP